MILMRILPGVLKELLKHVPTVLFEVVDWNVLAHEFPKLSRRIIKKEGYQELFELQADFLAPFKVNLVPHVSKHSDLKRNYSAAEKILTLYFTQLYSPHGVFLDLRLSNFEMDVDSLKWHPPGLWTNYDPKFSLGLANIYDGFYLEDEDLFHQGLLKIGLTSSEWPQEDRQKLAELFKANFGSSLGEMSFNLDTFKESFFNVADFMLEKKVKISTDFLYLGVSLITLYSALEEIQENVNVKEIYLEVKERMTTLQPK